MDNEHSIILRIALGSESHVKKEAVLKTWPNAKVVQYGSPSGVPDQPVGKLQTEKGARNRMMDAMRKAGEDWDLAIGIENGMWEVDSKWVDGAAIAICCKGVVEVIWSDTIVRKRRWWGRVGGKELTWRDCKDIPSSGHPRGPNDQVMCLQMLFCCC